MTFKRNSKLERKMSEMVSYQQILNNAAVICSKSEKCSSDIVSVFKKSGMSAEEIRSGIEYLTRERFIDDQRYALHFVHDKFKLNKWGKIKISYMLRQKHIADSLIDNALNSIVEEDYEATLRELLLIKVKSISGATDHERKGKLVVFAQGRGFESDISYRIAGYIVSTHTNR
jgi:regulatory protein